MDDIKGFFKKIKAKDRAAFSLLTDTYGWKLYSYIRRHTDSREAADRIFNDTFSRFYESMAEYDTEDPIETMLLVYADQVGQGVMHRPENEKAASQWEIAHEADFSLPTTKRPGRVRRFFANFFYTLCILALLAGILAALWFLMWMLMDMNLIPQMDLGYLWFNSHIADWFH